MQHYHTFAVSKGAAWEDPQGALGKVWGDLGYKDSDQASVQHSIQQKYDSVARWTLIFPIPLML